MTENVSEIEQNQKSIGRLKPSIIKETYGLIPITSKYIYEGQQVDKLIELDKYIKNHPELQETMPIFKLIFNGNIPKTYDEIIIDKQKLLGVYPEHKNKIEKIYSNIIKSDPILYLTHLVVNNKTKLIIDFINNHKTQLLEYQKEINEIIEKYNSTEIIKELISYNEKIKK